MLLEQTFERLGTLRLRGMAEALARYVEQPPDVQTSPTDLVGILADAECAHRDRRRLGQRLKQARLRQQACVEDIDYRHPRGLTKATMLELAGGAWLVNHQNIIFSGPTGTGKTYLACALAHKACRDGYTVNYRRFPRLIDELAQARADGTYLTVLRRLAKVQLLVIDDFGLEVLGPVERKILLEVLEDRSGVSSTIVTSQIDPESWHGVIGEDTVADAICDRLLHPAHRIRVEGESIRKAKSALNSGKKSAS